jgi:hypothetical protein
MKVPRVGDRVQQASGRWERQVFAQLGVLLRQHNWGGEQGLARSGGRSAEQEDGRKLLILIRKMEVWPFLAWDVEGVQLVGEELDMEVERRLRLVGNEEERRRKEEPTTGLLEAD